VLEEKLLETKPSAFPARPQLAIGQLLDVEPGD
jgi:hypothetical protein